MSELVHGERRVRCRRAGASYNSRLTTHCQCHCQRDAAEITFTLDKVALLCSSFRERASVVRMALAVLYLSKVAREAYLAWNDLRFRALSL